MLLETRIKSAGTTAIAAKTQKTPSENVMNAFTCCGRKGPISYTIWRSRATLVIAFHSFLGGGGAAALAAAALAFSSSASFFFSATRRSFSARAHSTNFSSSSV